MNTNHIPADSTFPTRPATTYALMTDHELATRATDLRHRLRTGGRAIRNTRECIEAQLRHVEAEINHPLRGRSYLI